MPSTTRVGSKTTGVALIGPPSGSAASAVTSIRPARSSRQPSQTEMALCGSCALAGDLHPHLVGDRAAGEPGEHLLGQPVRALEPLLQPVGLGRGRPEDVADPGAGAVRGEPAVGVDRVEGHLGEGVGEPTALARKLATVAGSTAGCRARKSGRSQRLLGRLGELRRRPRGCRSGTAARSGRAGRWPSRPAAGTSPPCRGCPASGPAPGLPAGVGPAHRDLVRLPVEVRRPGRARWPPGSP